MKTNDPRVQRVAAALVDLLDAMSVVAAPPTPASYTSSKNGPRPPGKTGRWCRENLRHVPGARKEGRDWVVSVAAYEEHFAARTEPGRRAPRAPESGVRRPWSPRSALEGAALRSISDGES